MEIKIKYLSDNIPEIKLNSKGNWIDLYAAEDVFIPYNNMKLIPLGVAMKLPKGFEAHLLPRSSTYKNWGIIMANNMGIIDESYCGNEDEWKFPAICVKPKLYKEIAKDTYGLLPDENEKEFLCKYANAINKPINLLTFGYNIELKNLHDDGTINNVYKIGIQIKKGDKICQFRIQRSMYNINFTKVDNLDAISRGGFGSTGMR